MVCVKVTNLDSGYHTNVPTQLSVVQCERMIGQNLSWQTMLTYFGWTNEFQPDELNQIVPVVPTTRYRIGSIKRDCL